MLDIDLNMISDENLSKRVTIEIKPYSLCHINDNSGNNFFSSNVNLSKNKIFGLLENLTQIHLDKSIKEDFLKRKYKKISHLYTNEQSTFYIPLISKIIDIIEVVKPIKFEKVLMSEKRMLFSKGISEKKINKNYLMNNFSHDVFYEDKEIILSNINSDFLDEYIYERTADFYSSIKDVEYIDTDDCYFINFNTNNSFYERLVYYLENIGDYAYLGDSDSLVNVRML
jgi:hypothetical protein